DDAIDRVVSRLDSNAARVLGNTASTYFTPEEKQAFLARLTQRRQAAGTQERQLLIDIADAAHLYDFEVALLLQRHEGSFRVQSLQERRKRFAELARQLEDLAARSPGNSRIGILMTAARAYQTIGDATAELQLFSNHYELQVNDRP